MPERGSRFELSLCGLRLCVLHQCRLRQCRLCQCVLRSFVWGVVAAGAACMGAAPPAEACTLKPSQSAPQGQHWYYLLDRAKRQCWYLGPSGLAVQTGVTRLRHRAAVSHARPPENAAAGPAAAPAAPHATEAVPAAAPAAADSADTHAPAPPPPEAAGVSERLLAVEPAPQEAAGESRSPEAAVPAPAAEPAPATELAPATEPAEALQPAATARPARAVRNDDHTVASIMVAAALLLAIVGVLWAMRFRSGRTVRAETPSVPPERPAPAWLPTPLVLARTVVRHRRPSGARDHATAIGRARLADAATPRGDSAGATRRSP